MYFLVLGDATVFVPTWANQLRPFTSCQRSEEELEWKKTKNKRGMWAWDGITWVAYVRFVQLPTGPRCQQLHKTQLYTFFRVCPYFSLLLALWGWKNANGTRWAFFFVVIKKKERKEREDELKIVDRRMVVWKQRFDKSLERTRWKEKADKREENDCFVPKSTGKLGLSLSLPFFLLVGTNEMQPWFPLTNSCDFLSTEKTKFGLSVVKSRERVTSVKRQRASLY